MEQYKLIAEPIIYRLKDQLCSEMYSRLWSYLIVQYFDKYFDNGYLDKSLVVHKIFSSIKSVVGRTEIEKCINSQQESKVWAFLGISGKVLLLLNWASQIGV